MNLNPGNGGVSQICSEPRVWLAVMEAMLAPYLSSGQLTLLLEHTPESASMDGDKIRAITFQDSRTGNLRTVTAKYFLDATEMGDVLPLTKTEFVTGTESHAETGRDACAGGGESAWEARGSRTASLWITCMAKITRLRSLRIMSTGKTLCLRRCRRIRGSR